jgi:hypothetical protein
MISTEFFWASSVDLRMCVGCICEAGVGGWWVGGACRENGGRKAREGWGVGFGLIWRGRGGWVNGGIVMVQGWRGAGDVGWLWCTAPHSGAGPSGRGEDVWRGAVRGQYNTIP